MAHYDKLTNLPNRAYFYIEFERELKRAKRLNFKKIRKATNKLQKIIEENPNKKIIIGLPLTIKDFSFYNQGWINKKTKNFVEYVLRILSEKEEGNL